MDMNLDFLTEEWKKIPQASKIFALFGVTLILLTWLIDHWGGNKEGIYTFWGHDIRQTSFNIGVSIILLVFLFIIAKQILLIKRTTQYRIKYPLKNLDTTFYLIWFNGKLILFDRSSKLYYHIATWATAQDLFFIGQGKWIKEDFEEKKIITLPSGKTLEVSNYEDGGPINTRI